MEKKYDENGDIVLTQDQKELCRLANFLYDSVDELLCLEDEKDFDIHPAVKVYEEACRRLKDLMDESV